MYNETELNYIWLDSFAIPFKKRKNIISLCGGINFVKAKLIANESSFEKYLSIEQINAMKNALTEEYITKIIETLNNYAIKALTIESVGYPEQLKSTSEPPMVLYVIGDYEIFNSKKCFAVVGTRRATYYGREVCSRFCETLIDAGLILVSGLAFGIDTCVAETAVSKSAQTIAVLAGGLDSIYPSQNQDLSRRILSNGGALVSEYPPGIKPTKFSFLERNRIISGLSLGVLVVEAGEHSGAEATANDCIEEGRELFVIPGNITSASSAGCNKIINAYPTVFCISPKQILKSLNINIEEKNQDDNNAQLTLEENLVLDCLNDEKSVDEICEDTKLLPNIVITALTSLEMLGLIKKTSGNYYVKITLKN